MSMHYYLHIPFCRQKCPYCKFALTPVFDDVKKRRYIAHLKREILASFRKGGAEVRGGGFFENQISPPTGTLFAKEGFKTLYFGGGTPSVLSLDEVKEILECFPFYSPPFRGSTRGYSSPPPLQGGHNSSQHSKNPIFRHSASEVSFECNPEDITTEYVRGLFHLGINRISLGVQSLNNTTLKAIHRSDQESIFRALKCLHTVIARNEAIQKKSTIATGSLHTSRGPIISTNIDFILGLPHSKPGETLENIKLLHAKFPYITHTSVYMLEEGLYPREWAKYTLSESEMEEEYTHICEYFDSIGWHHYEISSWARPGYECQHNQAYWDHSTYGGFGLSATSLEKLPLDKGGLGDLVRSMNPESFSAYYRGEKKYEEILTEQEITTEKIIYDLRTFRLDASLFSDEITASLEEKGLITMRDQKIILTPAGIFRENFILGELISE